MSNCYAVDVVLRKYPHLDSAYVASEFRKSTYVSLAHRYLYYSVAKAACSSLKTLILKVEKGADIPEFDGSQDLTRRDMMVHSRRHLPIPSLMDLTDLQQEEVFGSADFLRLLVVRNPYDRLVSTWRNKILVCEPGFEYFYQEIRGCLPEVGAKDLLSFGEFFDFIEKRENLDKCNPHWRRQTAHCFFAAMNFNFVGKTEKMGEVVNCLTRQVGADRPLEMNASNISVVAKDPAFTADLADRIYSAYRDDFSAFGYDRDAWPRQASKKPINEDSVYDEIVERNIIISYLHNEIDMLRAERNIYPVWISRLRNRLIRR